MEVLTNYIVELLVAGLLAVIGVYVRRWFGKEASKGIMDYIEKGVGYGKKAAKRRLGEQANKIDFENEVVDQAVKFVAARAPKWLRMADITEGALRELIEGELEKND